MGVAKIWGKETCDVVFAVELEEVIVLTVEVEEAMNGSDTM